MKNKKTEANISMVVSKTFSGLNMNALKYLLPLWMSPLTGASFRCVFAAVAFWVIGWFMKPEVSTTKDKVWLFLLGAIGIYGFMFLYLVGLSKTTPVSSSIFTSLQPIWVFLIMVFFYKEKATWMKILGILIGLSGALVCILTQQSDDLAADAFNGNMLCLASSVFYAVYLVLSQRILQKVGTMTMLRYTFTGAAFSSLLILPIEGFHAPLFFGAISLVAFCRIDVCAYFPYGNQLSVDSYRIEVFENYVGGYLWLSDLDRGNDYIPIDRARPFQLDTDVRHYLYLRRGLSG